VLCRSPVHGNAIYFQYIPAAGPFAPIEVFIPQLPRLAYQVFFEKETVSAIAELNKDIKRSLRSVFRTIESPTPEKFLTSTSTFLGAYDNDIPPPPFFSEEEEDYIVEQYNKQGFDMTLQFYCHDNRFASHAFSRNQGNWTIRQPALSIYPTEDPVANWVTVADLLHSKDFLPNLKVELIHAQHWPQLESPKVFNRLLAHWLDKLRSTMENEANRISDEL